MLEFIAGLAMFAIMTGVTILGVHKIVAVGERKLAKLDAKVRARPSWQRKRFLQRRRTYKHLPIGRELMNWKRP